MKNKNQGRANTNYNSLIIEILGAKPIAFNPILGRLAKSATAGLFLSQLLYWDNKGSDPDWTYKTIREIYQESCLTRSQQEKAIKIWKKLDVLEVELRGIPRKRYFHINKNKLVAILKSFINMPVSANQFAESCKLASKFKQTIYTENTPEKTNRDICFGSNLEEQEEINKRKKEIRDKMTFLAGG